MGCRFNRCNGSGWLETQVGVFPNVTIKRTICICKTAKKAEPDTSEPIRPTDCPYNACGGLCKGKGYYDYRGTTIFCSR
jgi:hypothetical protein